METFENLDESKKYEQSLREATYSYNIDLNDRSWFITPRREIWGDMSHRFILKNRFPERWNDMKNRGMDDLEIEEILTKCLIQSSYVKIGELDDFYVIVWKLDNRSRDSIQEFCKSILKNRDVKNSIITIHQRCDGKINKCIIEESSEDYLFTI